MSAPYSAYTNYSVYILRIIIYSVRSIRTQYQYHHRTLPPLPLLPPRSQSPPSPPPPLTSTASPNRLAKRKKVTRHFLSTPPKSTAQHKDRLPRTSLFSSSSHLIPSIPSPTASSFLPPHLSATPDSAGILPDSSSPPPHSTHAADDAATVKGIVDLQWWVKLVSSVP